MPPLVPSWWELFTPRVGQLITHGPCAHCTNRGPLTRVRLTTDGTCQITFANGTTKTLPPARSVLR